LGAPIQIESTFHVCSTVNLAGSTVNLAGSTVNLAGSTVNSVCSSAKFVCSMVKLYGSRSLPAGKYRQWCRRVIKDISTKRTSVIYDDFELEWFRSQIRSTYDLPARHTGRFNPFRVTFPVYDA
jgi:hypothetical protein